MSEQTQPSHEPMSAQQAVQAFSLVRGILLQRFPNGKGFGMMETDNSVRRKIPDQEPDADFKGILVDDFIAWPGAKFLEMGASPFARGMGEWNDSSFSEYAHSKPGRVAAKLALEEAQAREDRTNVALAEISYWGAADENSPQSQENPAVVYYYLGAEQQPHKTVKYQDAATGEKIKLDHLEISAEEADGVLSDLINVLQPSQPVEQPQ